MDGKFLGKIDNVYFGHGGYQDACIGIHFTFSYNGSYGCGSSKDAWDAERIKWDEHCQWTERERDQSYADIVRFVSKLLDDAKVDKVEKLKGKPIEVAIENMRLKDWRILTEVL